MSRGAVCIICGPHTTSLISAPRAEHPGDRHSSPSLPGALMELPCIPARPHLLVLAQQVVPLQEVLVFKLLLHQLVPLLQLVLLHLPQGCLTLCGGHATHTVRSGRGQRPDRSPARSSLPVRLLLGLMTNPVSVSEEWAPRLPH